MRRPMLALALLLASPPAWAAPTPNPTTEFRSLLIQSDHGERHARELAREGTRRMEDGQYEQALGNFLEALHYMPGDEAIEKLAAEARAKACEKYVLTGREQLAERQYATALNLFASALDLQADHADALAGKQAAERWIEAEGHIAAGEALLAERDNEAAFARFQQAYDLVGDPRIGRWLEAARAKQRAAMAAIARPTPRPRPRPRAVPRPAMRAVVVVPPPAAAKQDFRSMILIREEESLDWRYLGPDTRVVTRGKRYYLPMAIAENTLKAARPPAFSGKIELLKPDGTVALSGTMPLTPKRDKKAPGLMVFEEVFHAEFAPGDAPGRYKIRTTIRDLANGQSSAVEETLTLAP